MLVHIPVFVINQESGFCHQLQLLLTCLHSYYRTGNTCPLLVSTNDLACLTAIEYFKQQTSFPFDTELVDEEAVQTMFGYSRTEKPPVGIRKMVISKFHAVLRKLDSNILHVDYDTIFNRKLDIDRFFHGHLSFWSSIIEKRDINTGVMAFDQAGSAYLAKLIQEEGVLQSGKLNRKSIRTDNDEWLIMDIHFKLRPRALRHSSRKYCHCLAYELNRVRGWQEKANIIHFHWYKPTNCTITEHGPIYHRKALFKQPLPAREQARFNYDFYTTILMWWQHYNMSSSCFPRDCRLTTAPDDELLRSELGRLADKIRK